MKFEMCFFLFFCILKKQNAQLQEIKNIQNKQVFQRILQDSETVDEIDNFIPLDDIIQSFEENLNFDQPFSYTEFKELLDTLGADYTKEEADFLLKNNSARIPISPLPECSEEQYDESSEFLDSPNQEMNQYLLGLETNNYFSCGTPCGPDYKLVFNGTRTNYWCKNQTVTKSNSENDEFNNIQYLFGQAFIENDCMACLNKYQNAHYCSNVNGGSQYSQVGWCCGDYQNPLDKPPECYSVPTLNYKCTNDQFLQGNSNDKYLQYLRYAMCLDIHQRIDFTGTGCGYRQLYNMSEPDKKLQIQATTGYNYTKLQYCIWELVSFDTSDIKSTLNYQFNIDPQLNLNNKLILFDGSLDGQTYDLLNMSKKNPNKPIYLSHSQFNLSSGLYLLAKIQNPEQSFRLDFAVTYSVVYPLSAGAKFAIAIIIVLILIGILVVVLYKLQKAQKIDLWIPQFCRFLCLKGYMTQKEKKEAQIFEEVVSVVTGETKKLKLARGIRPGLGGFHISDDFFGDDPVFDPNQPDMDKQNMEKIRQDAKSAAKQKKKKMQVKKQDQKKQQKAKKPDQKKKKEKEVEQDQDDGDLDPGYLWDEFNPNIGFKPKDQVQAFTQLKQCKSIDHSPEVSLIISEQSAHDPHLERPSLKIEYDRDEAEQKRKEEEMMRQFMSEQDKIAQQKEKDRQTVKQLLKETYQFEGFNQTSHSNHLFEEIAEEKTKKIKQNKLRLGRVETRIQIMNSQYKVPRSQTAERSISASKMANSRSKSVLNV